MVAISSSAFETIFAQAFVRVSISTEVWKEAEDFRSHCIHPPAVSTAAFSNSTGILFDAHCNYSPTEDERRLGSK